MRPGKEEEESTATRPKRANVSKNLPAVWHVDNVSIEQAKKKASYLFGFNSNKKKKEKRDPSILFLHGNEAKALANTVLFCLSKVRFFSLSILYLDGRLFDCVPSYFCCCYIAGSSIIHDHPLCVSSSSLIVGSFEVPQHVHPKVPNPFLDNRQIIAKTSQQVYWQSTGSDILILKHAGQIGGDRKDLEVVRIGWILRESVIESVTETGSGKAVVTVRVSCW